MLDTNERDTPLFQNKINKFQNWYLLYHTFPIGRRCCCCPKLDKGLPNIYGERELEIWNALADYHSLIPFVSFVYAI